jgi:hypothetical protein
MLGCLVSKATSRVATSALRQRSAAVFLNAGARSFSSETANFDLTGSFEVRRSRVSCVVVFLL